MGGTSGCLEGGRPQCSREGVGGVDRIWGGFSELCGNDLERCMQGYTAVRVVSCGSMAVRSHSGACTQAGMEVDP